MLHVYTQYMYMRIAERQVICSNWTISRIFFANLVVTVNHSAAVLRYCCYWMPRNTRTCSSIHWKMKNLLLTKLHFSLQRTCDIERPCYREKVYPDGKLRSGNVLCSCPPKHFCPLYYIGGRRQALPDSYSNKTLAYEVFCHPVRALHKTRVYGMWIKCIRENH